MRPVSEFRGLLLDIGDEARSVRVPWDDPEPAIDIARKLLGLTKE